MLWPDAGTQVALAWGLWRSPGTQQHDQLSPWKPENRGFAPQVQGCVESTLGTSCAPEGMWLYLSRLPRTLGFFFFFFLSPAEEIHAEVCYAECLLQRAALTFLQVRKLPSPQPTPHCAKRALEFWVSPGMTCPLRSGKA